MTIFEKFQRTRLQQSTNLPPFIGAMAAPATPPIFSHGQTSELCQYIKDYLSSDKVYYFSKEVLLDAQGLSKVTQDPSTNPDQNTVAHYMAIFGDLDLNVVQKTMPEILSLRNKKGYSVYDLLIARAYPVTHRPHQGL